MHKLTAEDFADGPKLCMVWSAENAEWAGPVMIYRKRGELFSNEYGYSYEYARPATMEEVERLTVKE